ncbi:MAG TPA: hypothetical protein VFT45_04435 [Longimicrobium sp.]|nr:hypothetical protein [Longimicrobium sp.]
MNVVESAAFKAVIPPTYPITPYRINRGIFIVKLARFIPADELPMEPLVAEAVLEFGEDLREAAASAAEWAQTKGICRDAV